ncbi:MAG TPA: hypothetical protein VIQ81_11480 [Gammaproteobacteria bacterium]
MTDRAYRTLFGACILLALYFDLSLMMYILIGLLFAEGLTNQRVPILVSDIRNRISVGEFHYVNLDMAVDSRFDTDAERVWRLTVGFFLLISYSLIEPLWWFPWFMGFAIFGAGLSGICPVLMAIRWIGFK